MFRKERFLLLQRVNQHTKTHINKVIVFHNLHLLGLFMGWLNKVNADFQMCFSLFLEFEYKFRLANSLSNHLLLIQRAVERNKTKQKIIMFEFDA